LVAIVSQSPSSPSNSAEGNGEIEDRLLGTALLLSLLLLRLSLRLLLLALDESSAVAMVELSLSSAALPRFCGESEDMKVNQMRVKCGWNVAYFKGE
jgi:hypothetical protein